MNLWLKIKVWTKVVVLSLAILYGLLLILNNSGQSVKLWVWFRKEYEIPMLVLILVTLLVGVLGTLLVRTVLKTWRQIRELRDRNRAERDAKELADMRAKAAMLQTRPEATE